MAELRTRFAPSPTGYLHIGGARTALFNHLLARNRGGRFLLRVEDTDRERSTPESIQAILDGLRWLQLDWDEGPFFQSERTALYLQHAERLLAEGKAYRCVCPPALLEEKRKAALTAGRNPVYDRTCRDRRIDTIDPPFTVRFKAPLAGETVVRDRIKGPIVFQHAELDDLILQRSDGSPTYNFCVVVDDALMRITHVVRGEDHLANTPKQIQIYRALGFELPEFAHVPLILGLDRTRLSKRHGATSVTAYRDAGYLPDGLANYLVRLGWSHGDQEIFTRAEMIEAFSLDQVGTAAGVFNPEKLDWVNFQHLKRMTPARLAEEVKPFLRDRGWEIPDDDRLQRLAVLLQERSKTLVEMADQARWCLAGEIEIDPAAAAKHLAKANRTVLLELREELAALGEWTAPALQEIFERVRERHQLGLGKIAQPVRVALTGGTTSPGIFEVVEIIGRERALERLDRALALVGSETGSAARE